MMPEENDDLHTVVAKLTLYALKLTAIALGVLIMFAALLDQIHGN